MNAALPAELDRTAVGSAVIQVATDGLWERAQSVSLAASRGDVDELLKASDSADVALEVLWPGPPIVFVGTRAAGAVRRRVYEIAARPDPPPSQVLTVLAGGTLGPPEAAEIGAVNAWQSMGPLAIGIDAGAATISRALDGRIDLVDCAHPLALEISHGQPGAVWWAVEVSREGAGGRPPRRDQIAAAVRRGLDAIDRRSGRGAVR